MKTNIKNLMLMSAIVTSTFTTLPATQIEANAATITQYSAKQLVIRNFNCVGDYANLNDIKFVGIISSYDNSDVVFKYNMTAYNESLYKFQVAAATFMYVGVDTGKVYLDEGGSWARNFYWIENGQKTKTWFFTRYDGYFLANGWIENGEWYYYQNGYMKTGWIYDKGNWYYCYSNGMMAHDTVINGYYLNSSGAWVNR